MLKIIFIEKMSGIILIKPLSFQYCFFARSFPVVYYRRIGFTVPNFNTTEQILEVRHVNMYYELSYATNYYLRCGFEVLQC